MDMDMDMGAEKCITIAQVVRVSEVRGSLSHSADVLYSVVPRIPSRDDNMKLCEQWRKYRCMYKYSTWIKIICVRGLGSTMRNVCF